MPVNGQPQLTNREKEVLGCLAQGLSTEEISLQLGISFNTVESHRKALLRKFEAKNTAQMMLIAGRLYPGDFWKA